MKIFPQLPSISSELLEKCRERDDFRQILFEYYKHAAIMCVTCAHVVFNRQTFLGSRTRFIVLTGLFNRCQRLMAGHLEFFQGERYGDVTFILDRCILETTVKIRWISSDPSDGRLSRYLQDSLRADFELYSEILKNIEIRNGEVLKIEERMIKSIEKNAKFAGFTLDNIGSAKKAPPLANMISDLGEKRFVYTVVGKISSHAIHGSLANLLSCYINEDGLGNYCVRDEHPESHINQYIFNTLFILDACRDFLKGNFAQQLAVADGIAEIDRFCDVLDTLNREIVGDDFTRSL